jgi:transposase InsO family protein
MHGGYSEVHSDCIKMLLHTSEIQIPIVREKHNLPVVFDSYVSPKMKKTLASSMRSGLCHTRLNALDFFQDTSAEDRRICAPLSHIGPEHYNSFCGPCVGANANENLSAPQKELLKWHWKLGISMYRIQEMMRERHYEEPNGNKTILPAIIKPKLVSARNCIVPPCQSCLLARARKRTPNVSRTRLLDDREGAITRDQYNVGDFVSTDQFICKTPGRLPTGYGRESQDRRFQGGTIYNDAASGLIWVENQVSLGANETVMGKARFEQWLYDQCICEVKHYHGDNGIFSAEEFRRDCEDKRQSQSFSGVGAQHQNARAERAIQTIMYMARTFMVHASLHWTESGSDDISLWSFAVKHSVWVYNRVPNVRSGLTPLELVTRERSDYGPPPLSCVGMPGVRS